MSENNITRDTSWPIVNNLQIFIKIAIWHLAICSKFVFWSVLSFKNWSFVQIAQRLDLAIFVSVSLVREILRGLRENIKHKIWTLMVSIIAPCPFSLCRFPWKLGPDSLCLTPWKLGPDSRCWFPGKLAACRKGWCTAERGWCGGKGGALLRPGDGLLYLKIIKKYLLKTRWHETKLIAQISTRFW